jgi:hypothetical protein
MSNGEFLNYHQSPVSFQHPAPNYLFFSHLFRSKLGELLEGPFFTFLTQEFADNAAHGLVGLSAALTYRQAALAATFDSFSLGLMGLHLQFEGEQGGGMRVIY